MTGKEALEKIKNNQHYREEKKWIIATPLQNTEEYKAINKDLEELTKYKRAFEILKEVVNIANLDGTYLLSVWVNTLTPICYLKKEQGELLEELMKGEKN